MCKSYCQSCDSCFRFSFVDIVSKSSKIQPIIKSSNSHTNSQSNISRTTSSRLKRSKVTPATESLETHTNHIDIDGRTSPALSDRTDTNKSVKRVAFTDEPPMDTGSQLTVTRISLNQGEAITISGSPTELKRARRKREKNLRKRLLNKMGEAEVRLANISHMLVSV